jgi:hypothetical protein
VLGGFPGGIGITYLLITVLIPEKPSLDLFVCLSVLCTVGIFAIWSAMTAGFEDFDLNWFSLVAAVAPTFSTLHLLVLCGKSALKASDENIYQ